MQKKLPENNPEINPNINLKIIPKMNDEIGIIIGR